MSRPGLTFEGLKALTGQELGISGWITVDQEKINQFADCTGDGSGFTSTSSGRKRKARSASLSRTAI